MEWVETTGRTVAEALEVALDQLGVDEQDAEIVVLEEPKAGLFGLRRSEARVRARVRPTRPRPKRQQRDRRGRSRNGREGARSGDKTSPTTGRDSGREGDEAGDLVEVGVAVVAGTAAATSGDGQGSRRNRNRRGSRSRSGGSGPSRETGSTDGSGGSSPPIDGEDQVTVEEQAQLAQAFVGGVVERLGLAATTNVAIAEESTIEVSVEGDGLGLLIGPHGATLRALQELTRTATQRRSTEHGTRVVVDVAGYRAKRAAALAQFARSIAHQVIETGTPHSLEPMSASDRKIVHDTVNEIDGVRTASEGEESARHVVIYPVDAEEAGDAGDEASFDDSARAEAGDVGPEEDAVD